MDERFFKSVNNLKSLSEHIYSNFKSYLPNRLI